MEFESSPDASNYTDSGRYYLQYLPPLVPHASPSMDFISSTLSAPYSVSPETINPTDVTQDQQPLEVEEPSRSTAIPAAFVSRTSSKRRRDELKASFMRLEKTLPESNQKCSRVKLLDRATSHIRDLEAEKDQLEARLTTAYHEIHRLRCASMLSLAHASNFTSPSTFTD